ncbi:MAG: 16S rRNA (guanine(966)-N(2))-methyltransferase RsmD [Thermodesulfovibrionales bacterium]|nr:16S rRNA (guanine(966)-N(2))-methyltransferase RsmD [Thermodesulfovibrionales bacterium]
MIQITGGISKGRKVLIKKSLLKKGQKTLRPTRSKVRKALFDIIKDRVCDSSFLDLYAGTGAVGIEALSRGAATAFFVDEDLKRVNEIKKNLQILGYTTIAKTFRGKVISFLKRVEKESLSFDIIFADPPYNSDEINRVVTLIVEKKIIKESGLLIIEHSSKREDLITLTEGLRLQRKYKYGDTALSIYVINYNRSETINETCHLSRNF